MPKNDCALKKDIVSKIVENKKAAEKEEAEWMVNVVIGTLKDLILERGCVQIYGFGKFFLKKHSEKTTVLKNKKTGEKVQVTTAPHYTLKFKPSVKLKERVKETFGHENIEG